MKRRILWPAGFSTALLACGGSSSGGGGGGDPDPPDPPTCSAGIETPRAFTSLDFSSPVAMQQPPNDASRWYVVEQGGRIFMFDNDPDVSVAPEVLDLRDRVHREGEAGLLGMAFHPDFATNGLVYLNFSELVGARLRSVTAEYSSPDGGQTLDPDSERVLLTVDKLAANHNGGNIAFGPDRFLYIGLGDGGGSGDPQGNGQNPERLLGKMLRIDVNSQPGGDPYGIPGGASGNPFAGNPLCNVDGAGTQACPEIYALGFRNPWRWSFDRQFGDLWVGDVGQADWEEIDLVTRGGNYGWNVREGAHCFEPDTDCETQDLIDPVAEYGRDLGFSITGGYVYRGLQETQVAGNYVFGDFGGMIAWLQPDGAGGFDVQELVEQGCTPPGAPGALQISSFAQDLDGELFVLDYDSGEILQLEFTE